MDAIAFVIADIVACYAVVVAVTPGADVSPVVAADIAAC